MNGVVEIAGPDRSRLSDLMQRYFKVTGDARTVVTDESALYFGAHFAADTLLPGGTSASRHNVFRCLVRAKPESDANGALSDLCRHRL